MVSDGNQNVCKLITKGYFSQAKDRINNLKTDIEAMDQEGRTPLMLCSFIEETEWSMALARFVIQLGAKISTKDFTNQMNVFHYCCILEQVELLDLLLESVDFDINTGDCLGNTPLIYAIAINNPRLIESLIGFYQRYKVNVDKANVRGVTALMQACLGGNLSLIKQLLDLGSDDNIKDCEGKTAAQYKEEAISKSDLITQFNENRRQSRMVRFDDIELIVKLQQETFNLRQDTYKIADISDPTIERVRLLQTKIKRIKRNKIDYTYAYKFVKSATKHNSDFEQRSSSNIKKIRPKTAIQTTKELRGKEDWYSLVRPLYITLEQQHTTSFRAPCKPQDSHINHEIPIDKVKNRGRRSSRSIPSLSRKNSICGRLPSNDESSDSMSIVQKKEKKLDTIVSAKMMLRNFSRLGNRSSSNSINIA